MQACIIVTTSCMFAGSGMCRHLEGNQAAVAICAERYKKCIF